WWRRRAGHVAAVIAAPGLNPRRVGLGVGLERSRILTARVLQVGDRVASTVARGLAGAWIGGALGHEEAVPGRHRLGRLRLLGLLRWLGLLRLLGRRLAARLRGWFSGIPAATAGRFASAGRTMPSRGRRFTAASEREHEHEGGDRSLHS